MPMLVVAFEEPLLNVVGFVKLGVSMVTVSFSVTGLNELIFK